MTQTIALSTMYMQHRAETLTRFWEIAQDLGCQAVEVSHSVWEMHLAGFRPGDLPILAVHAPAPRGPNPHSRDAMRLISSPEEEARRWAVDQVKRSIDWAADVGARAVCVHLGRVEGIQRHEWVLEQRYLAGQRHSRTYARLLADYMTMRRELAPPYLNAARRSLDDLAAHAARRGLHLGLESRRFGHEIPNLEEAETLLADHDPDLIGFWYDCGHCQVTANLGFAPHQAWLDRLANRIVGVHVHDVVGVRDHLIPGTGEIDFSRLAPYIPERAVVTLELDWYFEPEEMRAGRAHVRHAITNRPPDEPTGTLSDQPTK